MHVLQFINHSSFQVETDRSILIVDPWLEGKAFNQGWSLLDKSTSNSAKLRSLRDSNKDIYIWYSHEHSDHLSFSFLNSIKDLNATILYKHSLDKRVVTALRGKGFQVEEQKEFAEKILDDHLSIETFVWTHEDSFSIIRFDDYTILNLNDCPIVNDKLGAKLKSKLLKSNVDKVDIVFTQFGYANWVGNPEQGEKRSKSAVEKASRIQIIDKHVKPDFVVLYASYIYFCHEDNYYMNDHMNTPKKIVGFLESSSVSNKLTCLKPGDEVYFDSSHSLRKQFNELGTIATHHWEQLMLSFKVIDSDRMCTSETALLESSRLYIAKMKYSFAFMPSLAEMLSLIKPINIYISDLDCTLLLSYRANCTIRAGKRDWDASMSGGNVNYLLNNDYGFNTTSVNALFRINSTRQDVSQKNFTKFFILQELVKWGITLRKAKGWLALFELVLAKSLDKFRIKYL